MMQAATGESIHLLKRRKKENNWKRQRQGSTKTEAIVGHQLLVHHDDPHRGADIEEPCSHIQCSFPVCFTDG